ncbi:acid-sensing ion channel 1-like isoform X1 [Petromyzon marinus]|uniref:Acid-sensing ion channel 1-like isoform X1 n=1 Tax=Petromyzon marinus TaxID=7757 RepID=A0AAJ7X2U7_PETMA|nr:acid-sensing ion channel 1-like isoform X1 [Petromyzon marinus]
MATSCAVEDCGESTEPLMERPTEPEPENDVGEMPSCEGHEGRSPSLLLRLAVTLAAARFGSRTGLHGVRHVLAARRTRTYRLLWLLACVAALALLLASSADRVHHLLSRPSNSKVSTVWPRGLTFPAITLCNNNLVRFSRLTRTDLHALGIWLGLLTRLANGPSTIVNLTADPDVLASLAESQRQWFLRLSDFSTFLPPRDPAGLSRTLLERLGHPLGEMMLTCRFGGQQCGPDDFTVVYTRYGKCYTFNSGKDGRPLLTSMKGGMGNGLEMMLDIQQDEYLPVWGETDETSFEAGIKVQIHSQDEPPFIDQLGFGVAPGFQTFVSCQEQRLTYLPYPWGDCKDTPPESEFFDTYSIAACQIDCETRYLVENCNCRMVHMPGDAPYCTPEQYKECANPALMFLVEKDDDYCACEMPCNIKRYAKELSMVKIPSQASAKYLAKKFNKTEAYIAENVLVLDIFFEALNYETIEQKRAYEVAGLLGDIGGHMGLFIGASILTILEIFDYLYEIIKYRILYYFCRNKKQRNISDNSVPMTSSYAAPQGHTQAAIHPHGAHAKYEDFTC